MINHIDDPCEISREFLSGTLCGKRILSYLDAYGTGYDFCRFFKSGDSVLLIENSTMLICGSDFDPDEINMFVGMYRPFRIEGSQSVIDAIKSDDYLRLHRTVFQLVPGNGEKAEDSDVDLEPRLDDVYAILSEGFPNISDHELWLADTSHRVRHGISRVFTYKGCTTASLSFDIDGCVLVSQVATKLSSRGYGHARCFLMWLAEYLKNQGKTAVLYALDIRESFYKEIGFKAVSEEYVLEMKENNDENILKGTLRYND
ncbi:MAG: N-acetyltransferase [Clostridium sp.]|nr:N-acetyltransferase [Clostridium sp.]MCM1547013.1 N-acetyltransferase [Ruminococcus sp.]